MRKKPAFEQSFASIEYSSKWSNRNGNIKPEDVFKSSGKKYWFDCDCGHEFENSLCHIVYGRHCPYCANQKLCNNENCKVCFEKSFASSNKVTYWSKNNIRVPREVFKSTHTKYKFNCDCGHEFESALNNIKKGQWCPFCSNPPRKLCDNDQCKICFNNSFLSNPKSKFWSKKNKLTPREVFNNNISKFKFNCLCGHEFEINLNSAQRSWCPFCSIPPKQLCDDEDCKLCFEKSFASVYMSKYWSKKNGNIKARNVFKASGKKYWFTCENEHEFNIKIDNITCHNTWCPLCKNKTESKLHEWLKSQYEVTYQPKYEWCKKKQKLPYDFAIEEFKILIELDGNQHFQDFDHWNSDYKEVQANDKFKMLKALQNGYTIIRIYQPDVLNDTIDWKTIIQELIELKDEWCAMYVSSNDIYVDEECGIDLISQKTISENYTTIMKKKLKKDNSIYELEVIDEITDKINEIHLEENEVVINESYSQENHLEEENENQWLNSRAKTLQQS